MAKTIDSLSAESVKTLNDLRQEVPFRNSYANRVRVGEGGSENLSVYETSKWHHWKAAQRAAFKAAIPEEVIKDALIGYFIKYPAKTGFLDRMVLWKNLKQEYGRMAVYSLTDGQEIWIEDERIILNAGEGIEFKAAEVHEIKKHMFERTWVCLMKI